ncbi:TIP-1 family-domain-containing protein [Sphaerosporella brunnea]|uniref:TIP-1 family-domain-containing protein n=1 Tax=Sphaerosporella brunnea TaxID=1250544 RepID=A0A5J5ED00_9PEZI|nr:TIP-1 family-domain-containing protein [Sphaerosporella brunnea]
MNHTSPRMPSLPVHADSRVQDYFNDKFQTLADLSTLDTLLASVQTQQNQLRSQLTTADSAVISAQTALSAHSAQLADAADEFECIQDSIDRRLLATTSADTATDAAARFEETIEKLRRLDVAKGYVDLLAKVQALGEEAHALVEAAKPEEALKPYIELQELARGLKKRNEAAEGVAVHLVDYVEKATAELWAGMRERLAGHLEEVLKKMGWPDEQVQMDKGIAEEFQTAFEKLLVLQGPDLQTVTKDALPLLPFEVLVKPLALRFRYHFEGDRPTNRIDKPEWFLAHLTGLVTTYTSFLNNIVQPVLAQSPNPLVNARDAITEFITSLLPIVRRKTKNLLPQIVDEAQLLSHFIHEMIKFDAEIREEFYYTPFGCKGPWKGMTHEVLVVENGFADWLKVEKEFALSRYHTILAAPDAWTLDYESVELSDSKPTKSAMCLQDLLETVTDSYRPLISFSQRLRFLIDIQIAILDQYHDRLNGSVEAFRVLSSSIARAVQGTSKEEVQSLSGLAGLERLCKVYGSAMYMENCMRDWGEDVFFLELWEDLESRAAKANPNKTLAGNMNIRDVASVTSSALTSGNDDDDGALFDETAGAYKRLRQKTEEMIVELVVGNVKDELKAYVKIANWSTLGDAAVPAAISPELSSPLTLIASFTAFLQRTLSPAVTRRIIRTSASALQSFLWDNVLLRNSFSLAGGRQFARDCAEVWVLCGGEAAMPRLREAAVLLLLGLGDHEEDVMKLRDVVKPVFEDNIKARECMGKLGVSTLTVQEVRGLLQRRVEAFGGQ